MMIKDYMFSPPYSLSITKDSLEWRIYLIFLYRPHMEVYKYKIYTGGNKEKENRSTTYLRLYHLSTNLIKDDSSWTNGFDSFRKRLIKD